MDHNIAFPGRYYFGSGRTVSTAAYTPPLNKLIAIPFAVDVEIESVALLVKVAGSSDAVMRLGIYDTDERTGLPSVSAELFPEAEVNQSNTHVIQPLDGKLQTAGPFFLVALFGGETAPSVGACAITSSDCQRLFGHQTLDSGIFNANATNAVLCDYEYGELPFDWYDLAPTLGGSALGLAVRASQSATP